MGQLPPGLITGRKANIEEVPPHKKQPPAKGTAMGETIIGIDPGKTGAIAVLEPAVAADVYKMPETERDVGELFVKVSENREYLFGFLELVHPIHKASANSTWKFGQNYGMLRAFLIACGIPFETVAPTVWQRSLRCLTKGDKRVSKAKAQELFPHLKITRATADALLIATYGQRKREGTL